MSETKFYAPMRVRCFGVLDTYFIAEFADVEKFIDFVWFLEEDFYRASEADGNTPIANDIIPEYLKANPIEYLNAFINEIKETEDETTVSFYEQLLAANEKRTAGTVKAE